MKTSIRSLIVLVLFSCVLVPLCAEDVEWNARETTEGTLNFPSGYDSWRGNLVTSIAGSVSIPMLRGDSIHTDSNRLELGLAAGLSPDTLELSGTALFQPWYFLQIVGGASVGSGWGYWGLHGLYANPANDDSPIRDLSFGSDLLYGFWGGADIRLLLEELTGNPWHRIGFILSPRVRYERLSSAKDGEAWGWQDDTGMNFNGFSYLVEGRLVGFFPLPTGPQEIGFGADVAGWLEPVRSSSTAAAGGWGSDVPVLTFFLEGAWRFDAWQRIYLRPFLGIGRSWTEASAGRRYFGNRVYRDTSDAQFGVTVAYTYEF